MAWPLLCSLASLALALRSRLPTLPRMAAAPLVVPASAFASELAYRTVTASTWKLQFGAASTDACDVLLLAAYTPDGVYLFRHDGRAGLSTSGKSTAAMGKEISFVGFRNEPDWRVALREILEKVVAKRCRRLAFIRWVT